jgi:hypothetical protein
MKQFLFHLTNVSLHVFHLAIIGGSVLLWIVPGLQIPHLVLQFLILISWLGIGAVKKDLGYCLITDLQRRWKLKHGFDFPTSYMVYLWKYFGVTNLNEKRINTITFSVFVTATVGSLVQVVLF